VKACTKCGGVQPLSAFSVRKANGKPLAQCKTCCVVSARRSALANPEKVRVNHEKWRGANPARRREIARTWASRNLANVLADTTKRRALLLNAVPPWADLSAIAAVYAKAAEIKRDIGVEVHVDHIIPLRGRLVSGLHVANNLRIVTADENLRKRNNLIEELV
jgi:hypothetical protein